MIRAFMKKIMFTDGSAIVEPSEDIVLDDTEEMSNKQVVTLLGFK